MQDLPRLQLWKLLNMSSLKSQLKKKCRNLNFGQKQNSSARLFLAVKMENSTGLPTSPALFIFLPPLSIILSSRCRHFMNNLINLRYGCSWMTWQRESRHFAELGRVLRQSGERKKHPGQEDKNLSDISSRFKSVSMSSLQGERRPLE